MGLCFKNGNKCMKTKTSSVFKASSPVLCEVQEREYQAGESDIQKGIMLNL